MMQGETLVAWMATYLIHSTVLILGAFLVSRLLSGRPLAEDALWKVALVGGVLTASLQISVGVGPVGFALGAPPTPHPALAPADLAAGDLAIPAPREGGPSLGWAQAVALGWAGGAAIFLLALAASWRRLMRRIARRRPLGGPLAALLPDLAAQAGLSDLRLTECADLGAPISFGIRRLEICLPERARTLSPDSQASLLAHEVAHLARRDPLWRLLGGVLERVLFFQPLNLLAHRRLAASSEYVCDDWAAVNGGQPLALARCLTEVAAWNLPVPAPGPVAAMAVRASELGVRVRRLVAGRACAASRGLGTWVALGALLAAVALAAPRVAGAVASPPRLGLSTVAVAQAPKAETAPPAEKAKKKKARKKAQKRKRRQADTDPGRKIEKSVRQALSAVKKAIPSKEVIAVAVGSALEAVKNVPEMVSKALSGIGPKVEAALRKALAKIPSKEKFEEIGKKVTEAMKRAQEGVRKALEKLK